MKKETKKNNMVIPHIITISEELYNILPIHLKCLGWSYRYDVTTKTASYARLFENFETFNLVLDLIRIEADKL